jgi:acyl carrier protein
VTREEIALAVAAVLGEIAPEVDLSQVRRDTDLRDELDIDSMDFLRFVVLVHERLGVDIPETDYPRVRSVDGCVAYLAERIGGGAATTRA